MNEKTLSTEEAREVCHSVAVVDIQFRREKGEF